MKKQILIYAFLFLSLHTYGQFSFGLKGGLNINNIGVKDLPSGQENNYKMNLGFHLGFFGQILITDKLSLIPEFQFTLRGASSEDISTNSDIRTNLNYLELPILLSYSLIEKIGIDLGPSFAYKISSVAKGENFSNNIDDLYDKNVDFGISTGVRFNVTDKIVLIGRYYYGIAKVNEFTFADVNNNQTTVSYYNRIIQLGIGYRLK